MTIRQWALLPLSALAASTMMGFSCQGSPPLATSQGNSSGSYTGTLNVDKSRTRVSMGQYQQLAELIDNPAALFKQASYTPLWTAEPGQIDTRLPRGCKAVPHEARLWEPWFRDSLKNSGQTLSTAEVLMIRDNVCMAVIKDPRTQFRPPQRMQDVAGAVEQVRKEILADLGVTAPSAVLTQMTMADAAWAWSKSQRQYGFDTTNRYLRGQKRWPTADEFVKENLTVECMMSAALMTNLLRAIDALHGSTGMKVGGISGNGHAVTGVAFHLGSGNTANSYYDPTAGPIGSFSSVSCIVGGRGGKAGQAGSIDRASIESLASRFLTRQDPEDSSRMGLRPKGGPDGLQPLGENWGKVFNLGNFVPYKLAPSGKVLNAFKPGQGYNDPNQGFRPFDAYYKQHKEEIKALLGTIQNAVAAIVGRK